MIIRVNLLRESEFRYQGAVSRGFLIRASSITVGILVGLFLITTIFQYKGLRQSVAWSKEHWEKIKPAYENVKAMQTELSRNRVVLNELKGWRHSRIEWAAPMEELRKIVPGSIQLIKFNVFGSMEVKKPAAADAKPAAKPENPGAPPPPPPPGQAIRKFTVSIEGRSEDKLADKVILQFVDDLRQGASFKPILDSVKLQGLRLETGRESNGRVFNIEATTLPREMK
jgi:hypothetical protein